MIAFKNLSISSRSIQSNGFLISIFVLMIASSQADSRDIKRLSLTSSGQQSGTSGQGSTLAMDISTDGRFILFLSNAADLVNGDTNTQGDIFLHDATTNSTERVNTSAIGAQALGSTASLQLFNGARNGGVSDDGQFIVFSSGANNLTPNDTNNRNDVYIKNRTNGQITNISASLDQAPAHSGNATISSDGRFVAFVSGLNTDAQGVITSSPSIYLYDRVQLSTRRISNAALGNQSTNGYSPVISKNGLRIVYNRFGETSPGTIFDIATQAYSRVAHVAEPVFPAFADQVSPSGRYITFSANSSVVSPNGQFQSFVWDSQLQVRNILSVNGTGSPGSGFSSDASISDDGSRAVFQSTSTNLVATDTNNRTDVFLRDTRLSQTSRLSESVAGIEGNGDNTFPLISGNGRFAVFASGSTNLVSGDTNGTSDVFLVSLDDVAAPLPITTIPAQGPLAYLPNGNPATAREIQITFSSPGTINCELRQASAAFSQLPRGRFVTITPAGAGIRQTLRFPINHCIPQATASTAEVFCREGAINGTGQSYSWPLTCPALSTFPAPVADTRLCRTESVPADLLRSFANAISFDGRYVLFGRADSSNARIDPRFQSPVLEVVVWDRTTQRATQLTTNSVQTYDVAKWRENGSLRLESNARVSFPVVNGQQVRQETGQTLAAQQITGFPSPTITQAATRNIPAGFNVVFESADGEKLLLGSQAQPFSLRLFAPATNETIDIDALIVRASDLNAQSQTVAIFNNFPTGLSGDGNRIAFSPSIVLLGLLAGSNFQQISANRQSSQAYVLDIPSGRLFEPAVVNQTIIPDRLVSSAVFTRQLGRTGTIIPLDRTLPFVGTAGNSDGTSEVYLTSASGGIRQLTNSPVGPDNDVFNSGLAFISYDETAVLFQSRENLASNNPTRDQQLFRYDISTNVVRQVTTVRSNYSELAQQRGLNTLNDPAAVLRSIFQQSAASRSADARVMLTADIGVIGAQTNATGIQITRNRPTPLIHVCD